MEQKAFRPVPIDNARAVLEYVTELTSRGEIVFTGTGNEYIWKAEHDQFKFVLTRGKNGRYSLAVYVPQGNPIFIRSTGGGRFGASFSELYARILWYQEEKIAPKVLSQLKNEFSGQRDNG